jgi:hypothetical protein
VDSQLGSISRSIQIFTATIKPKKLNIYVK